MQPSAFYQAWLGHIVKLVVQRIGPPGAYLSAGESDPKGKVSAILLPGAEVPRDVKPGSELEVFVYLDSEDRPIATLRPPKLLLGEVAFLDVTDKASFGAFVDWGMPKELLVPTAEQTCPLSIGNRQPIALYIDASGRLAGTMRVSEKLSKKPPYEVDQWVKGEAWRNDPRIGLFVILERRFVGLVPAQEPHSLKRGETAFFRVATVLEDGKVTLSLRRHALDERQKDAETIMSILRKGGKNRVGDHSSPSQIRTIFGMSKKAFKRAVGLLLKQQRVKKDDKGFFCVVRRRRIVR